MEGEIMNNVFRAYFDYMGNMASVAIYTKDNENLFQVTTVKENGTRTMVELTIDELICLVMTEKTERCNNDPAWSINDKPTKKP